MCARGLVLCAAGSNRIHALYWCCALRADPGGGCLIGGYPKSAAAAGVNPHLPAGWCDGFEGPLHLLRTVILAKAGMDSCLRRNDRSGAGMTGVAQE